MPPLRPVIAFTLRDHYLQLDLKDQILSHRLSSFVSLTRDYVERLFGTRVMVELWTFSCQVENLGYSIPCYPGAPSLGLPTFVAVRITRRRCLHCGKFHIIILPADFLERSLALGSVPKYLRPVKTKA